MSGPAPVGNVAPNFRLPRLVGILNVMFSTQILICGLFMGGYVLTIPLMARVFSQLQGQVEQQAETARKTQLKALAEDEEKAKTEQEKIEVAARRIELENRPKGMLPATVDFTQMGMSSPEFLAFSWTEILTGLALNVMMLVSGIGLMSWKPWARSLGLWTAGLKIVRLALVYGFFILAIVPPLGLKMAKVAVDMINMQGTPFPRSPGGAPPADLFARVYTVMYSGMGLGFMLFGMIYPAILLWLLTRPGVKAACSGRLKLPKEPKQPW
jgi:hypothetical protein